MATLSTMAEEEEHLEALTPDAWTMLESVGVLHYALIPHMGKLLGRGHTKQEQNRYSREKWLCYNCFSSLSSELALERHVSYCHTENGQRLTIPHQDKRLKYVAGAKEFDIGYVIFYDFETLQRPVADTKDGQEQRKTHIVTEHDAFAYSLLMVQRPHTIVEDLTYVGTDAARHFLDTMVGLEKKYLDKLKEVAEMELSESDHYDFETAEDCHICGCPFWDRRSYNQAELEGYAKNELNFDSRVRDHCHVTGDYVGAAHESCNLHRKECLRIIAYAHNSSGYDLHIVLDAIAKHPDQTAWKLSGIPINGERFKTLTLENIHFYDSLAFLNDSLDKLTQTLLASEHSFPLMRKWLPDEKKRQLMLRKGVFCYDFLTHFELLTSVTELPDKECFYSRLTDSHVSDEDYAHAQEVWQEFDCQNLEDYTRLYVRGDCYQLAEAVLDLRRHVKKEFGLDMTHYVSLPQLTKDALLKTSGVQIDYMRDLDMINMVRKNIRGGLSYVGTRHLDVDQASKEAGTPVTCLFVDSNNLYGGAMKFAMPTGDYRWLEKQEIDNITLDMISDDAPKGFIFEVTLDYPEELHRQHSAFPLAPHQMDITEDMLSPYAMNAMRTLSGKEKYKAGKLVSTFLRREKYVCHGLNLKLYLSLGMKLIAIHRVMTFSQAPFIKPYIERCTRRRAQAKTKTASNLAKILSNSLFGKFIENGLNRMDVAFIRNRGKALRYNTNPRLKGSMIVNESFSVAFLRKASIELNQCWAVGFSILDISKYMMQSLFYSGIQPLFPSGVSMLVTDTDSFLIAVRAANSQAALRTMSPLMDFSNLPSDHKLFTEDRKFLTGFLKSETGEKEIQEVVGLRSKVYAFRLKNDGGTLSKCKGITKTAKKKMPFEAFKECLTSLTSQEASQYTIQSKRHVNKLLHVRKTAYSSFYDKRYLLCAVHSVPYGSKLIKWSHKRGRCFLCAHPDLLM